MNLQHIEYFLQLAKYEHVSITADFLNISQPSLSKHIANLENELGIRLFDRSGNRIVLNKNGEEFARYARQALDLLNTGIISAKSKYYETTGHITIGCYSYSPIIARYTTEYSALNPLTTFQIVQCHSMLQEGMLDKFDFILYSSHDENVDNNREQFWKPQALFKEKYVLIAASDFPGLPEETDSLDLHELSECPFTVMAQKSVLFDDITYTLCMNAGFFPKIYCQTDEFIVKIKTVQKGLALAFLPESCLEDAMLLAPNLRILAPEEGFTERTVYIMRRSRQMMTENALDFWDFLIEELGLKDSSTSADSDKKV